MPHIKRLIAMSCFCSSLTVFAGSMASPPPTSYFTTQNQPWYLLASIGYGSYQHMIDGNGQTAIARLGFGKDIVTIGQLFSLGLEASVQTGNRMTLQVDEAELELLAGLPIETTIKESLDVLVNLKTKPISNTPVFLVGKAGPIFRRWQVDRDTVNDTAETAGEVQGGIGYQITPQSSLNLLYQGVFSGRVGFVINPDSSSGYVAHIPTEHAILLTLSINV